MAAKAAPGAAVPSRVISLAPSFTEIIYALGAQDRLVGVTQYCKYPPEAEQKPKVGALVNMNYEKLLSLSPDLVVLLPGQAEAVRDLGRLGVPTITLPTETIDDVFLGIRELGKVLGRREEGERLAIQLKEGLDAVRTSSETRRRGLGGSEAAAPRVLFVAGRNPGTLQQIYACGSGNFVNEMLTVVGAVNVMGETVGPWPVVNKETILKLDPDVILDSSLREADAPIGRDEHMKAWEQLSTLTAVRLGRVIAVTDERLTIPGPGIAQSARKLAELIYGAREREVPN